MPTEAMEMQAGSILSQFELRGLHLYEAIDPALLACKQPLQAVMAPYNHRRFEDDPRLAEVVTQAVANWPAESEVEILLLQGIVFERLGQALYDSFLQAYDLSDGMRAFCEQGMQCSVAANQQVLCLLQNRLPADEAYGTFLKVAQPFLNDFDTMGETLAEVFGSSFGISYSVVASRLVSDLVPDCVELGMERRKVFSALTEALMGVAG